MKITLIGIAAIIALYLYGNSLRKKKKEIIDTHVVKNYEIIKIQRFTVEEMLKWFKSHNDVNDNDEYVLSRVTQEALKKGGINIVMSNVDIEHSLILLITDSTHKVIKHARIVTYLEIEKDILDMLGDKKTIILE